MPKPEGNICAREGCDAVLVQPQGRGRRRKFCPDHEKTRGKATDPQAQRQRDTERAARQHESSRRARNNTVSLVSQMAAALAVCPKPMDAARFLGLDSTRDEVERLATDARVMFPDVIAGKPQGTTRLLQSCIHLTTQRLVDTLWQLAPRDLALAINSLARSKELMAPMQQTSYSQINLIIAAPDGTPLDITGGTVVDVDSAQKFSPLALEGPE